MTNANLTDFKGHEWEHESKTDEWSACDKCGKMPRFTVNADGEKVLTNEPCPIEGFVPRVSQFCIPSGKLVMANNLLDKIPNASKMSIANEVAQNKFAKVAAESGVMWGITPNFITIWVNQERTHFQLLCFPDEIEHMPEGWFPITPPGAIGYNYDLMDGDNYLELTSTTMWRRNMDDRYISDIQPGTYMFTHYAHDWGGWGEQMYEDDWEEGKPLLIAEGVLQT